MTVYWMAYAAVVSTLAGLAALALEPVARGRRAPTRFVWLGALAVSAALPLATVALPRNGASTGSVTGAPVGLDVALVLRSLGRAAPPLLQRLDGVLPVAWLTASGLMALALAGGLARLRARARGWTPVPMADGEVLVSDDFGPASFGLSVPRVVLPRWALELSPGALSLVVEHEREHGRAGDARLLLAGALVVVAAPWNPVLWWQLGRMRAAVEMDCDERVLRRGASAAAYGATLLAMGCRGLVTPLTVPGLTRARSLLERRMTMIVRGSRKTGVLGTAAAVCAAALLMVAACETPAPTGLQPPADEETPGTLEVAGSSAKLKALAEGATESLHGAEAAGGIVHIVTKRHVAEGEVAAYPTSGAAEARIFLDGVRYHGDLSEISEDDVERVEILKGDGQIPAIYITLKARDRD